jgi:hypothetical protein
MFPRIKKYCFKESLVLLPAMTIRRIKLGGKVDLSESVLVDFNLSTRLKT